MRGVVRGVVQAIGSGSAASIERAAGERWAGVGWGTRAAIGGPRADSRNQDLDRLPARPRCHSRPPVSRAVAW